MTATDERQSLNPVPTIRDGMFPCAFRDTCPGLAFFPTHDLLLNHYARVHSLDGGKPSNITLEDPDCVQQTNLCDAAEAATDRNADDSEVSVAMLLEARKIFASEQEAEHFVHRTQDNSRLFNPYDTYLLLVPRTTTSTGITLSRFTTDESAIMAANAAENRIDFDDPRYPPELYHHVQNMMDQLSTDHHELEYSDMFPVPVSLCPTLGENSPVYCPICLPPKIELAFEALKTRLYKSKELLEPPFYETEGAWIQDHWRVIHGDVVIPLPAPNRKVRQCKGRLRTLGIQKYRRLL
ncbi:hypothetical protein CPB85DRAFT_1496325 [Mucidula mucida]|nr:hypothetical protein CPB85DRAFT_1496325 [Mucidula mucida]